MAKFIPSGGNVISGKYERGLIYVDEEYKEIGIYKTQLQQMPLVAKLNDEANENYTNYVNQNRYFSITPSSILSVNTLGSFEENNAAAVDAAGRWFGTGAALVTAQMAKSQNHTVKIEYKDHTNSILSINDYVYQTLIVIASQVEKLPNEEKNEPAEGEKVCNICGYINVSDVVPRECPICHSKNSFRLSNMKTASNVRESNIQTNIVPENIQPTEKTPSINININPNNVEPTIDRIELFIEDEDWESAKAYCNAGLDYFPKEYRLYQLSLFANNKVKDLETLVEKISPAVLEQNSNFKKALRFGQGEFDKEYEKIVNIIKEREKEREALIRKQEEEENQKREYTIIKDKYDYACSRLLNIGSTEECISLARKFKDLNGFEDSEEKQKECIKKAKAFATKEINDLKTENDILFAKIKDDIQNISALEIQMETMGQELKQYENGLNYDIKTKEEELLWNKSDIIRKTLSCSNEIEILKETLIDTRNQYDAVKSSFFNKSKARKLSSQISDLEIDIAEKEDTLNNLSKEKNKNEQEYDNLIVKPRNKINDLAKSIKELKDKKSYINDINTEIERNKYSIEKIERLIEENDLFN